MHNSSHNNDFFEIEEQIQLLRSELDQEKQRETSLISQYSSLKEEANRYKSELKIEKQKNKVLNKNYKQIINSTSWKLTKPTRFITGLFKVKRKKYRTGKSYNTGMKLNASNSKVLSQPRLLNLKLFGGFSDYAVEELIKIKNNPGETTNNRLLALQILSKWYYDKNNFTDTLKVLNDLDDLKPMKSPGLNRVIPKVEVYNKMGLFQKSKEILWDSINNHGLDANLCLGMAHSVENDAEKLKWLNLVYEKNGLSPLIFKKQNEKLTLSNIMSKSKSKYNSQLDNFKISVLIPAYNAEELIHITLESLLNQTHQNFELLVVDDCSSDNTVSVVEQFAKKDTRIKLIKKDKNEGAYGARNTALKYATGDYITVHDSDDWSHPQKFEVQLRNTLENKNSVGSISYLIRTDFDVTPINRGSRLSDQYIILNTSSLLLKKEVFEKLGEWDHVRVGSDSEFYFRIKKYYGEESIVHVDKFIPFSLCLSNPNSLTITTATSVKTVNFGLRRTYREAYKWWHNKEEFLRDPKINNNKARKFPSPIPNLISHNKDEIREYDLVIISDFSKYSDLELYKYIIGKHIKNSEKVGIFHYPHYEKSALEAIDSSFMEYIYSESIDILVPLERIHASKVLFCNPEIFNYKIDGVPYLETQESVIVSQDKNKLNKELINSNITRLFNVTPSWVSEHSYNDDL